MKKIIAALLSLNLIAMLSVGMLMLERMQVSDEVQARLETLEIENAFGSVLDVPTNPDKDLDENSVEESEEESAEEAEEEALSLLSIEEDDTAYTEVIEETKDTPVLEAQADVSENKTETAASDDAAESPAPVEETAPVEEAPAPAQEAAPAAAPVETAPAQEAPVVVETTPEPAPAPAPEPEPVQEVVLTEEVSETKAPEVAANPYDTDNDGLENKMEPLLGTDPNNPDSDGDGLLDGEEFGTQEDATFTNPMNADTDNDGVNDGNEVARGTSPHADACVVLDLSSPAAYPVSASRTFTYSGFTSASPEYVDVDPDENGSIELDLSVFAYMDLHSEFSGEDFTLRLESSNEDGKFVYKTSGGTLSENGEITIKTINLKEERITLEYQNGNEGDEIKVYVGASAGSSMCSDTLTLKNKFE